MQEQSNVVIKLVVKQNIRLYSPKNKCPIYIEKISFFKLNFDKNAQKNVVFKEKLGKKIC